MNTMVFDAESAFAVARESSAEFDYETAFCRNIGWVTEAEQHRLRLKRVAIAGLGGVGGAHAATLARLGIGRFHLADFDSFDLANFNRQYGATMATIGRPKAETIAEVVHGINPQAMVEVFPHGVASDAVDKFLAGVDLYVDGIDFFALPIRRALFARARALGIPAVTAAPLGTSVAWLVFVPNGMSFDDYFGFRDGDETGNYRRFFVGLAPRALHMGGLVDRSTLDLVNKTGPSTAMGCMLCAGVAGTEALKILLNRSSLRPAPWFHQFDAYSGRRVSARAWFGGRNPMRQLKLRIVERLLARPVPPRPAAAAADASLALKVIDLARWAPSGDNDQPWRFQVVDEKNFRVRFRRWDRDNPYEYAQGRPILLAAGALLEASSLAANRLGARIELKPVDQSPDNLTYEAALVPGAAEAKDELGDFLTTRSVDRGPYRSTPLTAAEKRELSAALPDDMEVVFLSSLRDRFAAARLNSDATVLRMRLDSTYHVHKAAFRFDARQPEIGIPADSIPLDTISRNVFGWILKDAARSRMFNRAPGAVRLSSLQIDVVPGLACGAHFALRWRRPNAGRDWIAAGRALMRFWLTVERLGLVMQPSFAPVVLAHSVAHDPSALAGADRRKAAAILCDLTTLTGDPDRLICFGRTGWPRRPLREVRSHRLPLETLLE
jgi:sulfur-carrier protein adenylyltransferase/sulfurtransferase